MSSLGKESYSESRLDKSVFSIVSINNLENDARYWWSRSSQERLIHLEELRRINYGHKTSERLQRILEIA
ncbi:hypothetical protein K8T06_16000 [bacterium]|nr:hypothetical protein [bacterium]